MYVCVCNAIRECDFRLAARKTGCNAESVYAALGKTPNCGHCLEEAEEVLFEERELATRSRVAAADFSQHAFS